MSEAFQNCTGSTAGDKNAAAFLIRAASVSGRLQVQQQIDGNDREPRTENCPSIVHSLNQPNKTQRLRVLLSVWGQRRLSTLSRKLEGA